jgi:hypothetical protein
MRAMAAMSGERPMATAWVELLYAVKTGGSAFEKANGSQVFDYFHKDAELASVFHDAMTSRTAMEARAVTDAFDFSAVKTLVDVAGGQGLLLSTVLAKTPQQRGVLFETPIAVASAGPVLERAGVASRCEVVAGDFFEGVPRGDGYLLKHILHDWDDASCVKILQRIRAAAAPGARLFVIEAVLEAGNAPHFGKLLGRSPCSRRRRWPESVDAGVTPSVDGGSRT